MLGEGALLRCLASGILCRFRLVVVILFLPFFGEIGKTQLITPVFVMITIPSGSARLTFTSLYSVPSRNLMSAARVGGAAIVNPIGKNI